LLDAETLRTCVLLLYGAGLRLGEALALNVDDVDLSQAIIIVRQTKFYKTRLVPLGRDLIKVLITYRRWRNRHHPSNPLSPFFRLRNGKRPSHNILERNFRLLCLIAQVSRDGGQRLANDDSLHSGTTRTDYGEILERADDGFGVLREPPAGFAHLDAEPVELDTAETPADAEDGPPPGQVIEEHRIGQATGHAYNTEGMVVRRLPDDLFRHRILGLGFFGLGTGDFIVKPPYEESFEIHNVWKASRKQRHMELMIATRITEQAQARA